MSRRRRREFSFETLEARQVMSAASPVAPLLQSVGSALNLQATSYSSNTAEGQLAQLLSEIYWQSISSGAGASLAEARSIPTDPLLSSQWHLINSGQNTGGPDWQPIYGVPGEDLNVAPVWNQGYTGAGVAVAVIDSGVQIDHPDLAANIDPNRQFNAFTGELDGSPTDPVLDPLAGHGTSVAGLIGAVANNGIGGAGIAPGVTLVPINLGGGLGLPVYNALRFAIQNDVDVTNNSYGPSDALRTLAGPSALELLALRDSVIFGRDPDGAGPLPGRGIINVWSSGNGAGQYGTRPGFSGVGVFDSSNYDGYANSRYTIAVTGVDHDGSYNNVDGSVSNYMEAGANVLVATPTGSVFLDIGTDILTGSGLWTTDLIQLLNGQDVAGFNTDPDPDTGDQTDLARDYLEDTSYTSRFNGTSGSAPLAAGVIALMLEANPELTWRDVQEILVRSARQNDPLSNPTNGAGGLVGKNSWITNQTNIFHDPDLFLPNIPIDGQIRQFFPTLDPNAAGTIAVGANGAIYSDHYVGSPSVMTNGAGYTVSQGRGVYAEQFGYAHGVIDAELAVAMAEQWHVKNQALPGELTFTSFVFPSGNTPLNIPAAERGNLATGFLIVPGGIGGAVGGGFISYWNEYFEDDAFEDPNEVFPFRGQSSLEFSVPDSNAMTIESVDVKLTITGNPSEAMDHLRLLLVSPTGTASELNHYWYDTYPVPFSIQDPNDSLVFFGDPGSAAPGTELTWTFNTNRSWGERSDDALMYDPITNEPVTDTLGLFGNPNDPSTIGVGEALKQGWRLVIENWDFNDELGLQGVELAWHGSPIAANSQRIQGIVGIDDDGNDAFNFSRVIQTVSTLPGEVPRLGDVVATPDLAQESFASNVTVTVRRTDDGSLVDRFVTGHDGNFYFDLVPDDYTITVEDPENRAAKQDFATGGQFLRHYQTEWQITEDWFRAWDYDEVATAEVKVNGGGTPLGWFDDNGEHAASGMREINFLLDPGPEPLDLATFTGVIYADVNGDGAYNGDDINMPNVSVFGDVNRNGQRDPGEVAALTDSSGAFTLNVPLTFNAVMNVAVQRPTGWTSTNDRPGTGDSATDGIETFFVQPGDEVGGLSFAIKPPANNAGGGGPTQPGSLLGVVFEDVNGDRIRQATDLGTANVTVFLDNNNSGVPDAGDVITTTNEHGAYVFTNLTPGQRNIRIVVASPVVQTTPVSNAPQVVTLTGSSTISNILFGIRNSASLDFGDLPAIYGATLEGENGARHTKGPYWLGERIDAELTGHPSANADGDDLFLPHDDEDGIVFDPIVPGSTARIVVTASRNNGVLQGWVDWNNDGDFNDVGERVLTDRALNVGANEVFFDVPAGANVNQVFARFRYGEHSLGFKAIGTPFGLAQLGEVEDYKLNVSVPALPQVQGMPSDADQNGVVDGADFLAWQRNVGMTSGATQAQGDANGDDRVNRNDLNVWRASYGESAATTAAAPSADFNGDGQVDGADFLALQRNSGTATATVSAGNFAAWADSYGEQPAVAAAASVSIQAAASSSSYAATSSGVHVTATTDGGSYFVPRSSLATLAAAADDDAIAATRAELSRRPLADLVRGAMDAGKPVRREVADADLDAATDEVIAAGSAAWDVAAEDYLRQDRAFADLFGSRRRQGLRIDADAELAEAAADCDEAFAVLADHFEWPRG